jgi:hypothetical protein
VSQGFLAGFTAGDVVLVLQEPEPTPQEFHADEVHELVADFFLSLFLFFGFL